MKIYEHRLLSSKFLKQIKMVEKALLGLSHTARGRAPRAPATPRPPRDPPGIIRIHIRIYGPYMDFLSTNGLTEGPYMDFQSINIDCTTHIIYSNPTLSNPASIPI